MRRNIGGMVSIHWQSLVLAVTLCGEVSKTCVNQEPMLASLGVSRSAKAITQTGYLDVPDNHWVFETLLRLKKDGLYDEFKLMRLHPEYFHIGRDDWGLKTRTGVAAAIVSCCKKTESLADLMEQSAMLPSELPKTAESINAFASATANQAKYRNLDALDQPLSALVREFNVDILALNEDPVALKRRAVNALHRLSHLQVFAPGSTLNQFKDVPPDHWAAKHLLELRKLGILRGYSNNCFLTSKPSPQ